MRKRSGLIHRLDPEFVGLVLYTSGRTGVAQAITKKLGQLAREVATLERQFGQIAATAEILSTVSHQHIYGLLFRMSVAAGSAGGRFMRAAFLFSKNYQRRC